VGPDRLEALYPIAMAVGLRKGEAPGLSRSDLDLETGCLTVRSSLQRIDGQLVLVPPKSRQSRRPIMLPDFAVDALRRHHARQLQQRLLEGPRWQEHGLVCPTTIGTPMDTRNLSRHFARILDKAGLPPKRLHELRDTCTSFLLAQGVHPRVDMEILGHSQIGLTISTYSHVIPGLQKEAADRLNSLFAAERAEYSGGWLS
jgi:integrase